MPKSMTGYGKNIYTDENHKISVEIKSVNSRYLELNNKIPRSINYFEDEIRKIVGEKIKRGRVDLYVQIETFANNTNYSIDEKKVLAYKKIFDDVSANAHIENDMKISDYIELTGVVSQNDEVSEELEQHIKYAIAKAIEELNHMRTVEGDKIVLDMMARIDILRSMMSELEKHTQDMISSVFDRLKKRVEEVTEKLDVSVDESKIIEQAAFYADKMNVTEEIVRFESHIEQLKTFLVDKNDEIGKKIDFLIQEMNREINTIGSKSQKKEIVSLVVDIKSELEKIREQIQNIQ